MADFEDLTDEEELIKSNREARRAMKGVITWGASGCISASIAFLLNDGYGFFRIIGIISYLVMAFNWWSWKVYSDSEYLTKRKIALKKELKREEELKKEREEKLRNLRGE